MKITIKDTERGRYAFFMYDGVEHKVQIPYDLYTNAPLEQWVIPSVRAQITLIRKNELINMVNSLKIDFSQSIEGFKLGDWIIEKNDEYHLTREEIADRLDELADAGIINIDLE